MSLASSLQLLAVYNQWINESIYQAAARLKPEELAEDRGAFFGSILGTLNHILVGDTLWLKRFAAHPQGFSSLTALANVDNPASLDTILYSDFAELTQTRYQMDHIILQFSQQLTEEVLATSLSYHNTQGQPQTKNFGQLLLHFFNHHTHHRGQVSTLLHQVGIDIGVTDLLVKLP